MKDRLNDIARYFLDMNELRAKSFSEMAANIFHLANEVRIEDLSEDHFFDLADMISLNADKFGELLHEANPEQRAKFIEVAYEELQRSSNYDTTTKSVSEKQLLTAFFEASRKLKVA